MIRILIIIMDTPSLNSTNSHRRKLVKKRPSHQQPTRSSTGRASNAGRDEDYTQSTRSSSSITRRPSAPHAYSSQHYTTSTASSPQQPDPSQGAADFAALPLQDPYPNYLAGATHTPTGQAAAAHDDFIGAPFDSAGILNRLDAAKATSPVLTDEQYRQYGQQSPTHRPPIPPAVASYSSDLQRFPTSPGLVTMDSSSEKSHGSRLGADHPLANVKRLSDDGRESKGGGLRKKSGLTSFVNSLVGAPKKPVISAPENPVHLTHVGYDSNTGQFTVCPLTWRAGPSCTSSF